MYLLILARRYWRHLLPLWLIPVVVMGIVVAHDLTRNDKLYPILFLFVLVPYFFLSLRNGGKVIGKSQISQGVFFVLWAAPVMVIWTILVFLRICILYLLGQPF